MQQSLKKIKGQQGSEFHTYVQAYFASISSIDTATVQNQYTKSYHSKQNNYSKQRSSSFTHKSNFGTLINNAFQSSIKECYIAHNYQQIEELHNSALMLQRYDVQREGGGPLMEVEKIDEATLSADPESLKLSNTKLSPEIQKNLEKRGITSLFPIQKAVFDPIYLGVDIIARAKTGSGKTLAFGLPIVDKILNQDKQNAPYPGQKPRCIIMLPTRELTKQVHREIELLSSNIRTVCIYGGVPERSQTEVLRMGVDIVIGTPGRVLDLVSGNRNRRQTLFLDEIQFVVLDESDEMLNMGFQQDIEQMLRSIPPNQNRQTLLFSATLPRWVRQIGSKYQKNPRILDLVGNELTGKLPSTITVYAKAVQYDNKVGYIHDKMFSMMDMGQCIIFCNTKRNCDMVKESFDKRGAHKVGVLHGDKTQDQRERTMDQYRNGILKIIIATDVAARGLDLPNVNLVIHYDIPQQEEQFIHRSGRTGRAGKSGNVVLLVSYQDYRTVDLLKRSLDLNILEAPY